MYSLQRAERNGIDVFTAKNREKRDRCIYGNEQRETRMAHSLKGIEEKRHSKFTVEGANAQLFWRFQAEIL